MKKMAFIIIAGVVLSLVFYLNPAFAQRHGGGYSGHGGRSGDTMAVVGIQADTLAVVDTQGDTMVVVGTRGDTLAAADTDTMAVVGTQEVITTVTVRGIIRVVRVGSRVLSPWILVGLLGLCLSKLVVVLPVCLSRSQLLPLLLSLSQFLFLFLSFL